MEVSVCVCKIIKCAIYSTVFSFRWRFWWHVDDIVINQKNYQGCQFDVHFIQYEESTYILGIVNEFVQYVQSYFQYLDTPTGGKNKSRKSW